MIVNNRKILDVTQIENLLKTGSKITLPNGYQLSMTRNKMIYRKPNKDEYSPLSNKELSNIIDSMMFWETQDGEIHEINNMTTSHIQNVLKAFENRRFKTTSLNDRYSLFSNEFNRIIRDRNLDKIINEDDENYGLTIF